MKKIYNKGYFFFEVLLYCFSTSTNVSMKKCKIDSSLALRFTAGALINDIIDNLTTPIVISVVQNLFFVYIVIPTFSHKNFGAPSRYDKDLLLL